MYKCEIVKMMEKDNYENGCVPETFRDFDVIDTIKAKSIAELVKKVKSHYDLNGAEMSDKSLSTCVSENEAGDKPSKSQLEAFKKGEIDLYNVSYVFYFSEITETEIFPSVMIDFFKGKSVS